jgi:hypothetical protein
MKYKSVFVSLAINSIVILAFALCGLSAPAATKTWNGSVNNDWFTGANWTPSGVPTLSDNVYINNGGKAIVSASGAYARSVTIGEGATDSGELSVDGGALVLPGDSTIPTDPIEGAIYVGKYGHGTFEIIHGGTVDCGYGYVAAFGGTPASNGAVTVNGSGSTWTLTGSGNTRFWVAGFPSSDGGTAVVTITNGAAVIVDNPSPTTGAQVGVSGTLTGDGSLTINDVYGNGYQAKLLVIRGTLVPDKSLKIVANLFLSPTGPAATVCNVTPAQTSEVGAELATLNGSLTVNCSGTFSHNTQFRLLHCTGFVFNNTFASVTINYSGRLLPYISYDYVGNNVYLVFP